jgi:hypothetical protein
MQTLPPSILAYLLPFRAIFLTRKTFLKASLLFIGALMCQGARTICSVLKILGLKGETAFAKYHHVLNRSKWEILKGSKILLQQIDQDQKDPLKIVIDGHLERRKGPKITAKGNYRDAVQSSKDYTVISSGLKWLSVMALKKFSWCKRTLALPFLTVLMPHHESNKKNKKKHKTLQKWTCQIVMQIRRWFPSRKIVLTADNEFATADIALCCSKHKVAFVSRLKLSARLFKFPFRNHMGRPRNKGMRLPKIEEILNDPNRDWEIKEVVWYGGFYKKIQYLTDTCLWHVMTRSSSPIPIRYVLVKDPEDKFKPILLMSTDLEQDASEIIETYVIRWNVEVTFSEAREHLGIETQRQWSDKAIARTTPILFALYSLVVLIGNGLVRAGMVEIEQTAWYSKDEIKFSDLLRAVRKHLLEKMYFCKDEFSEQTEQKSKEDFIRRVVDLFLHAA